VNAESGESNLMLCVFVHFLCVYSNCVIIHIETINDQNGLLITAIVEVSFLLYIARWGPWNFGKVTELP
jgi:hypothetical protein